MTCTPSPWPPMSEWPTNLMPLDAIGFMRASCKSRGVCTGDLTEHRTVGEAGAAGVVEPEDAADQLARGVEPGNGLAVRAQDLFLKIYSHPAKTEGDAARDRVGLERRCIQRVGPVGFVG